jgi:hypothetical protein
MTRLMFPMFPTSPTSPTCSCWTRARKKFIREHQPTEVGEVLEVAGKWRVVTCPLFPIASAP